MRVLSTKDFIKKALSIQEHKNEEGEHKYTYEKVEYINSTTKVIVTCKIHGDWEIQPNRHLANKQGCKRCAMGVNKFEFKRRVTEKFGNKFDISNIEYINLNTKIVLWCDIHKEFIIRPHDFLKSPLGCPQCGLDSIPKQIRFTTEQFLEFLKEKHPDNFKKYDYTNTIYLGQENKIEIKCLIHGAFLQTASDHIGNGAGCQKCKSESLKKAFSMTYEKFMSKVEIMNRLDEYDFSQVKNVWQNAKTKIPLTCNKCSRKFEISPQKFLSGQRCNCYKRYSVAVTDIIRFLGSTFIKYKTEYWEKSLNNPLTGKPMYIDFMFFGEHEDKVCAIEFNGLQHTSSNHFYGGEQGLLDTQQRDKVKREWLDKQNIPYLDIWYNQKDKAVELTKEYLNKMGLSC